MWSNQTAKVAHPWKVNMTCSLAGLDMPVCNCLIKHRANKKMFVAHWQIYHIDQHVCCIVCEQYKDRDKCPHMTNHEAEMKLHVTKIHADKLKSIIDSKMYVNENAWLDMTSFRAL